MRLFKRLSGQATLVNVRPFEDPDTCWKSILMRIVQELNFPDRFGVVDGDDQSPVQLEFFAQGVLSQVVADLLAARKGNEKTIAILRKPAGDLAMLKDNRQWRAYLYKNIIDNRWIGEVERRLARAGISMRCAPATWPKVLYEYVYSDDWGVRRSCLDWIQCDPIDDDVARRIGMVDIVRRRKFLSLDELMETLPGKPDREAVLGICGDAARIKVHAHPNVTIVQWQSTA